MFKRVLALICSVFVFTLSASAQVSDADRIMVVPFENTSGMSAYNWVGESFADALSDLLRVPGLNVVTNEERQSTQQKMRLPLSSIPSLATSIRMANASQANLLVIGKYNVKPLPDNLATELSVVARVVRVTDGQISGEVLGDGRWIMRAIDLKDALSNLQGLQGQLAFQVLYQRDKALAFSQNDFVAKAKKVPQQAFEAYMKGMLTADTIRTADGEPLKPNFFKRASQIYSNENGGEIYADAAIELGHFYLRRNDAQNALEYFSRIQSGSTHYPEAAFYTGLLQWKGNNIEAAQDTYRKLSEEVKLSSVYNNTGAVAIDLARRNQQTLGAQMLRDGIEFLKQSVETTPNETSFRFNYGYALFLNRDFKGAIEQLQNVVAASPNDGYAHFLLAKSFEKTGETEAAALHDNQARRFLTQAMKPNYANLQEKWASVQDTSAMPLRLKDSFNRAELTDKTIVAQTAVNDVETALKRARELYQAGRNEESLTELRKVQMLDVMNADAYLLIGSIHFRTGDIEPAISNLKAAIFWNPNLAGAHVLLGRIFLDRKDCGQAAAYANDAKNLEPNNQDVLALVRRIEMTCK